jgi:high-affinity iron transporter
MFGTGLIVFRETLEAALFIGILAAATRSLEERTRWLALGVGLGVVGSILIASLMEQITMLADGFGQDVLNVTILSTALLMLAWHTIWVSAHAREMTEEARRIGVNASQNTTALWAVTLAVAMTVLREGAETVLFVSGLISASSQDLASLMAGASIGGGFGVAFGWLIYRGLGHIQPRRLFATTNVLILFLAGHLSSQLAKTLQQADWVVWLNDQAWDSNAILSNDSLFGLVLHSLIGYEASPSQLQVLFYLFAIALIGITARKMRTRTKLV